MNGSLKPTVPLLYALTGTEFICINFLSIKKLKPFWEKRFLLLNQIKFPSYLFLINYTLYQKPFLHLCHNKILLFPLPQGDIGAP